MIKLFNETDTTFSTNGDVVLDPTYAVVHKEDNGDYYLDLETNLTNETKTIEPEVGENITINGNAQITADSSKEVEITSLKGQTTQASTPSPSTPVPINVVTGEQDITITNGTDTNTYEINLGKNLFDKDTTNVLSAYFESSGDTIKTNTNNKVIIIACKSNTSYTLTQGTSSVSNHIFQIATTNETPATGTIVYNFAEVGRQANYTYTTNNTAKYIVIRLRNGDYNDSAYLSTIQLEVGTQPTSYSAYKTPIELCKIGNYQDKIYKDNGIWYLHKEIGKVVLDGTNTNDNYANGCYQLNTATSDLLNRQIGAFSNYFKFAYYASSLTSNLQNDEFAWNGSKLLTIKNTNCTSAASYRTWLSTTKPIFYYIATPTNTPIEDTELIEQLESIELLEGLNNISITSANLPGLLDLHYNYVTGGEVSVDDYIASNKILVANTPTGDQAFRITNIDKTRKKIRLQAKHITYDSENYVIQDSYVVDKTCNQALDHLNSATDNTSPFTMTSDITLINSYRCVRKSLWEALEVVIERWGGHLTRDNWNIGVMDSIGADNGVVVRYAKNLKNIQVTYDWSNVVTKILPVGQDGLLLDEVYLYADTQYDIPYTKVVHFSQDIDEEQYRDENGQLDENAYKDALKADLRTQARNYLQINYIPQVNYELNANLEKITDIGDTIEVIDERLGLNLMTNLIAYDYDCILERYKTLEFGNFKKTLSSLTTYIDNQTNEIVGQTIETTKVTLQNELQQATSQLWGVLGSSYVLVEGDKILIVDSLPKETATNVIMLNSAGIGFSNTGINGTFSTALTIDGTFNTSNVNVINFTADLIKGGELKLGSNLNQNGILEVYDEANNLIAQLDKNGLRMNAVNGAYVLINQAVGFAGYDRNDNPIYWVSEDEFHMKKSVVEEEITLVDKMRIIPITITENGTVVNDGIGFVSTL